MTLHHFALGATWLLIAVIAAMFLGVVHALVTAAIELLRGQDSDDQLPNGDWPFVPPSTRDLLSSHAGDMTHD